MSNRKTLANAIRFLSMDAVQKANSGHPGAPMGMADLAEVVWRSNLKHNPVNPAWPDRDTATAGWTLRFNLLVHALAGPAMRATLISVLFFGGIFLSGLASVLTGNDALRRSVSRIVD